MCYLPNMATDLYSSRGVILEPIFRLVWMERRLLRLYHLYVQNNYYIQILTISFLIKLLFSFFTNRRALTMCLTSASDRMPSRSWSKILKQTKRQCTSLIRKPENELIYEDLKPLEIYIFVNFQIITKCRKLLFIMALQIPVTSKTAQNRGPQTYKIPEKSQKTTLSTRQSSNRKLEANNKTTHNNYKRKHLYRHKWVISKLELLLLWYQITFIKVGDLDNT